MTQTTLNFEQAAKDSVLSRVLTNAGPDWREQVDAVVASLAVGTEVTGEDIVNRLLRKGLIEPTGQRVAMRAPGSHARKTDVYRRT